MQKTINNILVIIVTWNGMKWIERCLNSLRTSTMPVKTLIIDNGSKDDTVRFVRDRYTEIEIVQSDKNLGFGQANNLGFRRAISLGVDYVFLLNQDAYVYPEMFAELIQVAEKKDNKDYAIFSPLHVHRDGKSLDAQFKDYIVDISPRIVEDFSLSKVKEVYPIDCVPAAGWLLPIRTLKNIGGFDPIFFHYGEDEQYAQRIIFHGYKIGLVPNAKMIHDRDGFGHDSVAQTDAILRSMKVSILLNINISRGLIMRKMTKLFFLFTYESIRCALRGDLRSGKDFFIAYWGSLLHLNEYKHNRANNRKQGALWL